MKLVVLQLTEKINSLNSYTQAVDNRLNEIRDGIPTRYEPHVVDLSAHVHELERLAMEMKGMAPPGINTVGSPERYAMNSRQPEPQESA